jgi:hypothetical protein
MEPNNSNPEITEHPALLYGIQRSGSNYIQQLLLRNFENIRFYNQSFSRCLPTHKHFRLYNEKSAIPDARFYNTFFYNSFKDFREHAGQVAEREIKIFFVCIKDPYSWYLSYKKHARKNNLIHFKRSLNSHYLVDYNLFYRKWLDFSIEAPDNVVLIRYEDLIEDLNGSLQRIEEKFGLNRFSGSVDNPTKVHMSREFTRARSAFYREKKYLALISDRDKHVIQHLLDRELVSMLNYQITR